MKCKCLTKLRAFHTNNCLEVCFCSINSEILQIQATTGKVNPEIIFHTYTLA